MKAIRPVTITDAMFVSSTVAEPAAGESAWNSGTAYTEGQEVILASTHRTYRALQAGTNHNPAAETDYWEDIGPTKRWAMFDSRVNTQSSVTSPLAVVFDPGLIDSIALFELEGTQAQITMTDGAGGPTVYDETVSLQQSFIGDWYAYFFEPFSQKGTLVLMDLPPYSSGRVTVTITDSGGGTVKCGVCTVGTAYDIGGTQYGVQAGIRDYSRKETDETTGVVTLVEGRFKKTLRAQLRIPVGQVKVAHTVLTALRATPCAWVANEEDSARDLDEALIVYGFLRDFSLTVDYPTGSLYSIEIEGMT